MFGTVDLQKRLTAFEDMLDEYYRKDPIAEANTKANEAVDDFNRQVEEDNSGLEAEIEKLNAQLNPLREIEQQIEGIDQRLEREPPDLSVQASVEAYNRRVGERNALVQKHRELAQSYEKSRQEYEARVRSSKEDFERRHARLDEVKRQAEAQASGYRNWIEGGGPERFCHELNEFYASLHKETRRGRGQSAEQSGQIEAVRKIRKELGAHVKRREETAENGLLVVESVLCRSETCFMFVDTGSTVVTVTPELVEVLDLSDRIEKEIEVILPGAIRIKAPKIVLPVVSVFGMEAEGVEAVILKGSQPGIDGCLGLSFLNRFNYHVEKERPQKLLLEPLGTEDLRRAALPSYDIFICHKSEDLAQAHIVFDALTTAGYRPFLSDVCLKIQGEADFRKAIDAALESAVHLVAVGSSRRNLEDSWVQAEWGLFVHLKRSGKKRGNILNVLCGNMTIEDLPIALSGYQAVFMSDPNWRSTLTAYLPHPKE